MAQVDHRQSFGDPNGECLSEPWPMQTSHRFKENVQAQTVIAYPLQAPPILTPFPGGYRFRLKCVGFTSLQDFERVIIETLGLVVLYCSSWRYPLHPLSGWDTKASR